MKRKLLNKNLLLLALLFMMVQLSFGQNSTETTPRKRGVIRVRKKKIDVQKFDFQPNQAINFPAAPVARDRADIEYPPCPNMGWFRPDWFMKGFPNKAFNREYIIDAMHVKDCENVTLFYITKGDTTAVNCLVNFDEDSSKVTFNYQENEIEKKLKFDYTLKIESKRSVVQPADGSFVAYDTTAVELILNQKKKSVKYRLVNGINRDPHSYFPGICKAEQDTVHQWISDQIDEDGFRHKIIFRSCTEIEIQYRNPKKKNRKEGFKVVEKPDGIHIELSRQRINVSDKYFNSEYTMILENDKLVLQNKVEKFTYSVYKK